MSYALLLQVNTTQSTSQSHQDHMNQQLEQTTCSDTSTIHASISTICPLLPLRSITLDGLQESLDTLYNELLSIQVVYKSLVEAMSFAVKPPIPSASTEEILDDIDAEVGIACDDLAAQVRKLHRQVNRLERDIRIFQQQMVLGLPVPVAAYRLT